MGMKGWALTAGIGAAAGAVAAVDETTEAN